MYRDAQYRRAQTLANIAVGMMLTAEELSVCKPDVASDYRLAGAVLMEAADGAQRNGQRFMEQVAGLTGLEVFEQLVQLVQLRQSLFARTRTTGFF